MRFRFEFNGSRVYVWFTSSKEEVKLGTLEFLDSEGDTREDIQKLLRVILEGEKHPMLTTEGSD